MYKKIIALFCVILFSANIVVAQNPRDVTAKYAALGEEWNKVITDAQDWLRQEPDNAVAHFLLALAYHFTKDYPRSYSESKFLTKNKDMQKKVIAWAEGLVKDNPENYLAYYMLSSAYSFLSYGDTDTDEGRQRVNQAIAALKRAIELNPKSAKSYSDLAVLAASKALEASNTLGSSPAPDLKQKYDDLVSQATTYSNQAAALEPGSLDTYVALATAEMAKGDLDSAISHIKKTIEIAPLASNYMLLASAYVKKRDYAAAVESAKKTIELDSQEAFYYANLSLCYYAQGSSNEAINAANQAIKLDPGRESLFAYLALGMAYYKSGQVTESKKYFQKVIELDPRGEMGSMAQLTLKMIEGQESAKTDSPIGQ